MLRNLSTGIEASATGESLNSGDPAVHPAARHNIDIVTGVTKVNRGGSIPVTFTPRRATPLASAFFTGISNLFLFKPFFLWNRSSPSLIRRVRAPGTFQQLLESLVSLTHKQSVCTGYLPATPISFIFVRGQTSSQHHFYV